MMNSDEKQNHPKLVQRTTTTILKVFEAKKSLYIYRVFIPIKYCTDICVVIQLNSTALNYSRFIALNLHI